MTHESDRLLTVLQAAEYLGVSKRTVHTLTQEGKLPAVRLAKRIVRYDPKSLQQAVLALQSTAGNS